MRVTLLPQEWRAEEKQSKELLTGKELDMKDNTSEVAQELVRAVKSRKSANIKYFGRRSSTGVRLANLHRAAFRVDANGNVFAWLIDDLNNYEMPLLITPAYAKLKATDFAEAVVHIGSTPFNFSVDVTGYATWQQIRNKKKKKGKK